MTVSPWGRATSTCICRPDTLKRRSATGSSTFTTGRLFGALNGTRGVLPAADHALDELLGEKLVGPAILVAVAHAKGVVNGRSRDLVPG